MALAIDLARSMYMAETSPLVRVGGRAQQRVGIDASLPFGRPEGVAHRQAEESLSAGQAFDHCPSRTSVRTAGLTGQRVLDSQAADRQGLGISWLVARRPGGRIAARRMAWRRRQQDDDRDDDARAVERAPSPACERASAPISQVTAPAAAMTSGTRRTVAKRG